MKPYICSQCERYCSLNEEGMSDCCNADATFRESGQQKNNHKDNPAL